MPLPGEDKKEDKEEEEMKSLVKTIDRNVKIQVGFQYLQTSSVREALQFWESGKMQCFLQ